MIAKLEPSELLADGLEFVDFSVEIFYLEQLPRDSNSRYKRGALQFPLYARNSEQSLARRFVHFLSYPLTFRLSVLVQD
jgi:hypothetical protein